MEREPRFAAVKVGSLRPLILGFLVHCGEGTLCCGEVLHRSECGFAAANP